MPEPTDFFARHEAVLQQALEAAQSRRYWSPHPESPSPRAYGETAAADGQAAFEALRGKPFPLDQAGAEGTVGSERSPFGMALDIAYPKVPPQALVRSAERALQAWRRAGPRAWAGVSIEILQRLNRRSFEIAQAVQHTTGQGFMMAFQAGGPHAQDRGLEAVAYAWQEMSRIPARAQWEKPQGKHDPLRMEKTFAIVPRGVALVIGCATFPTWNGYPGLFASLATGNAVIVKPHPDAILPLAITVQTAREVLAEAGFDPDVVQLAAHAARDDTAQRLATDPAVRIVDFTGSSANGEWLETHARQALVYTEKAGVNPVIIESTADFKGMVRNLSFSLALYSGQMCTAPQNLYVPRAGVDTPEGHVSFDEFAQALGAALQKLAADPAKAVELTGAIQSEATVQRVSEARALGWPVLADSQALAHPQFEQARVHTPLLLQGEAGSEAVGREWFGPVAFVIPVESVEAAIDEVGRLVRTRGALSLSAYTTRDEIAGRIEEVARDAGVNVSFDLTGAVLVNQTAAFSDFHGTGANPAGNAALSDSAFVANRFRVVQSRRHA